MKLSIQKFLQRNAIRLAAIYFLPAVPFVAFGDGGATGFKDRVASEYRNIFNAIRYGDLG